MPGCLIDEQDGVRFGSDIPGDFLQVEVHGERVALGQDEPGALALLGTDRAKDVGRGGSLIVRRMGTRSFLSPTVRDLVFLSDASLVLEPDFYSFGGDALFARDFFQARGEAFLNSSIEPSAWA
jgi:hypothetical protein